MSNSSQQVSTIGRTRRRARALVRQHQSHDPIVADLLRTYHPAFAELSLTEIFRKPLTLSDAQFVLMREQSKSAEQPSALLSSFSVGKPRVIRELIERPEYRRELAAKRGLPPIGTQEVSEYGMEYTVVDHGFVLSQAGVPRANGSAPIPNIDEFMPLIVLNMPLRLLDLYSEVDRCTSKHLFFFDTMPHKFPRQAIPGTHSVQTTQDPRCLTFHLDACRLHETILAHELGHLWIEFVDGCEDWRNLKDQSDLARITQFQHLQSFVLDLKVNELIQSRGFEMSVIDKHQQETIREMARHCAKGELPRTPRAAAGMVNAIAAAMLEQKRWSKSALPEFQANLALIKLSIPEAHELAEQFVASVERHGYADHEAICRVIDECAVLSFYMAGDDFDPDRDLVEERPIEWMWDKRPDFLPGFPVSVKLEVWKEAARYELGAHVKWALGVTALGQANVRLQDGSGRMTESVAVSLNVPADQIDFSQLRLLEAPPNPLLNPLQKRIWQQTSMPVSAQPHLHVQAYTPHTEMPMAMPSLPMVPSVSWLGDHIYVLPPNTQQFRHYMAGVGLFLSRAGFEEQQAGEQPYGYAENNPLVNIDPSGLAPITYQGLATCFSNSTLFCSSNPENKHCPTFEQGMTGAVPNVYYDWRQLHCRCPFHRKAAYQPGLYSGFVKCGSSVTVSKGNCSITIKIIDVGPHAGLKSSASVDLNHKAYAALYKCLNQRKKKVPTCRNADPISGVRVIGQSDDVS